MAVLVPITDPDDLNQGTEVTISTAARTIALNSGSGNLDDNGVTMQALYSFLKEEWRTDADLIKFPFPITAITPEQFEWIEGWTPANSATSNLIRTAGWREVDENNIIQREYSGIISLGNIDSTDPNTGDVVYYFFGQDTAATDFDFAGSVNQAVQTVLGIGSPAGLDFATTSTITRSTGSFVTDGFKVGSRVLVQGAAVAGNNGTFTLTDVAATTLTVSGTPFTAGADATAVLAVDRRAEGLTVRIRVFGKTYGQSTTADIGVPVLFNQAFRFPLSEAADLTIAALGVSEADAAGAAAPYSDMAIGFFATPQTFSGFNALVGDTPTAGDAQFGVVVNGDVSAGTGNPGVATAEQIYAFVQASLASTADINTLAGAAAVTVAGQIADPLLQFVGSNLESVAVTTNQGGDGSGVYVDSFNSNDTNRVSFEDNDGDTRSFPFVAAGALLFNNNLQNDASAKYFMFFTNDDAGLDAGNDYGTAGAILVDDNAGSDITGDVGGSPSIAFDYDYDGNVQRGAGSAGTDAPITIIALGLGTAQFVATTGVIRRAVGQNFSLVAALERNFSNP